MRENIKDTRNAEVLRSRPYITVLLEPIRSGFYNFKITNLGLTHAKNLKIKSVPEITGVDVAPPAKQVGEFAGKIGFFHHTITYLAPQQSLEALVGHYSGIKAKYPDLTFKITLCYDGVGGPFIEEIELSLNPSDESLHLAEHNIGDELHKIRETISSIERKIKF